VPRVDRWSRRATAGRDGWSPRTPVRTESGVQADSLPTLSPSGAGLLELDQLGLEPHSMVRPAAPRGAADLPSSRCPTTSTSLALPRPRGAHSAVTHRRPKRELSPSPSRAPVAPTSYWNSLAGTTTPRLVTSRMTGCGTKPAAWASGLSRSTAAPPEGTATRTPRPCPRPRADVVPAPTPGAAAEDLASVLVRSVRGWS
jgi:hypothetical protein